ncbi:sulfate transporter family-domain-containing protein [Obelidium mucronatum]|nr:sulfate transporter family-domain-containing protein [Obelidium mucronatum]
MHNPLSCKAKKFFPSFGNKEPTLEAGITNTSNFPFKTRETEQEERHAGEIGSVLEKVFPLIKQMRGYNSKLFIDDLITAFTVAFVLLPQSIAYSSLAEIPPMQALITAIIPPVLYIIFGASRQLSVGPEAVVSVVTGSTIAGIMAAGTVVYTSSEIAITLAFLVGCACLIIAILQGGFIDSILSGYMLIGFVMGVSNLICVEQLPALLGLNVVLPGEAAATEKLKVAVHAFSTANGVTVAIGVLNVAFLLIFRRFKKMYGHKSVFLKKAPEILILVVVMISLSAGLDLHGNYKVNILGTFNSQIPTPAVPILNGDLVNVLIQPAIIVLLVGFIESQTVTKKFGLNHGYYPSGDQEMFAFGVINIASSFFGGYPVFGSLPRSRILANTGGRTTLANSMAAIIVLIATLTLGPVLKFLPKTTLASIVFVAALGLIELKEIGFVLRLRSWAEIGMFIVTWMLTIFFAISTGLLVCLGFSALLIVRNTAEAAITVIGRVHREVRNNTPFIDDDEVPAPAPILSGSTLAVPLLNVAHKPTVASEPIIEFQDVVNQPYAELLEGVVMLRFLSRLMFYNIGQVRREMRDLIHAEVVTLIERKQKRDAATMGLRNSASTFIIEDAGPPATSGLYDIDDHDMHHWWSRKQKSAAEVEDDRKLFHTLVLDFKGCADMDASAAFILHKIFHSFELHDIRVVICGLKGSQAKLFKDAGWYDSMKADIFDHIEEAVEDVESRIERPRWRKKYT